MHFVLVTTFSTTSAVSPYTFIGAKNIRVMGTNFCKRVEKIWPRALSQFVACGNRSRGLRCLIGRLVRLFGSGVDFCHRKLSRVLLCQLISCLSERCFVLFLLRILLFATRRGGL